MASLQAGEPVEIIFDVDTLALDAEAFAMAHAEGRATLGPDELSYRRTGLASIKQAMLAGLEDVTVLETWEHLSTGLLLVETETALQGLLARPELFRVYSNDAEFQLLADESLPLIGQDVVVAGVASAPALGGEGTVIAILDTGIDYLDPFFGCTDVGVPADCPVIAYNKIASQSEEEPLDTTGHGTTVSAVAHLVAPKAKLVVADMMGSPPAGRISDAMAAFTWVIGLKESGINGIPANIVAVNIAWGIQTPALAGIHPWIESQQQCEVSALATTLSQVIGAGIQPVASAGNNAQGTTGTFREGLPDPACVPGVVSVGAVYDKNLGPGFDADGLCTDPTADEDQVTCFSQTATFLSLLAPGAVVQVPPALSSVHIVGTSFAAPHVAGAWAILRSVFPDDMQHETLERLTRTGKDVDDHRVSGGRIKPRLDLLAALDEPDGDRVPLLVDNCSEDQNPGMESCDTDMDGFGNACDCDLNNDWICNTTDIPPMKAALVNNDPIGDIDCSGATNTGDIDRFKALLVDPRRPGPSGLECAGTIGCTP